jgi:hypothetical protein
VAEEQNVEHIFARVPTTGSFDIVVQQVQGGPESDSEFGLAWWFGNPFQPTIPGDFDEDDDVDDDDFDEFKSNFGTGSGADADNDGDSDGADFLAWQQNYGTGVPPIATAPEPAALMLVAIGLPVLVGRRVAA